jgi:AcrR family transcriptional regulator
MTRPPRGEARPRLIAAARALVRRQGYAATSVEDLCAEAGVTKGAFFHHFASKEALGLALVQDWTETTGAMFAAHPYNAAPDPLDRVFAYLDLRRALLEMPLVEFTCVAGTVVQECHASSDALRKAAADSLASGAAHVRRPCAAVPGGGAGGHHPGQGRAGRRPRARGIRSPRTLPAVAVRPAGLRRPHRESPSGIFWEKAVKIADPAVPAAAICPPAVRKAATGPARGQENAGDWENLG